MPETGNDINTDLYDRCGYADSVISMLRGRRDPESESKIKTLIDRLMGHDTNARREAATEIEDAIATGKLDKYLVIIALAYCMPEYKLRLSRRVIRLIRTANDAEVTMVLKQIIVDDMGLPMYHAAAALQQMDEDLFIHLFINEPEKDKRELMLFAVEGRTEMRLFAVIDQLLHSPDDRDRANALYLLPYYRKKDVTRMLSTALGHKDEAIRARAAVALSYGDRSAVVPLIEALKDPCGSVRAGAAFALGCICPQDEAAMSAVRGLLRDKSGKVRKMARRVMVKSDFLCSNRVPA